MKRFLITLLAIYLVISITGCTAGPTGDISYMPESGLDWKVSTPGETGMDQGLIDRLYINAGKVETIESLLVIKDGYLIAEKYFGSGSIYKKARMQSVTKSITSALTGIAIDEGSLGGTDLKMMEYFPELKDSMEDSRKMNITVGHLLKMRAGYPWEESDQDLFDMMYSGFKPSYLVDVPLIRNPGEGMEYSNLTSHILGIVTSRAVGKDLYTYAEEKLFGPLGIEPGEWITDWEGNNNGHADLHMRARDMAKFGLLYLDGGVYENSRVISSEWIEASLKTYSEDAWKYKIGRNVKDMGYGYQWWSVKAGNHRYNMAWGHGGQQIILVEDYNMVIVVTADPLFGQHGDKAWTYEKQNLNLTANFVASLP